MALLQIETTDPTAELYKGEDGWRIAWDFKTGAFSVVGPAVSLTFPNIQDLMMAPELPALVKWAARGLPGIPLEEFTNGASS